MKRARFWFACRTRTYRVMLVMDVECKCIVVDMMMLSLGVGWIGFEVEIFVL
jgi:hypothetical protein